MPDCLGLFAILKKQSGIIENRMAQPERGFVCCTRIAQRSIIAVNLLYAVLFAVLKNGISAPNQLYLPRPFSPYAIRGKCTHLTRLGTIAADRIQRQTRKHYTLIAICPGWRRCSVSTYPDRSGLAQSSSRCITLSQWAVFVGFALSIRFSRDSIPCAYAYML